MPIDPLLAPAVPDNPPACEPQFPLPSGARVAVIGAGASGLAMIKALRERKFKPVAFEVQDQVGGTWILSDEKGLRDVREGTSENADYGVDDGAIVRPRWQSSMYQNLRTNLPKDVMAYPDLPFDSSLPSFVTREDVLEYLQRYSRIHDLQKYISFKTWVTNVEPLENAQGYRVESVSVERGRETSDFSAVAICSGHYSKPKIPDIPGSKRFPNRIYHSHDYLNSKPFKGKKNVMLVGAGPSGLDLAVDLSGVVETVWLIHSHSSGPWFENKIENVTEASRLIELNADGTAVLEMPEKNGSPSHIMTTEATFDAVVLCTGYRLDFPFLDLENTDFGLTISSGCVIAPLYRDVFNMYRPDMCLVGIPHQIVPLLLMHYQSQYIAAVWSGALALPPIAERQRHFQDLVSLRQELYAPYKQHYFLKLRLEQFDYCREMASELGQPGPTKCMEECYFRIGQTRREDIRSYRDIEYCLGDGAFQMLSPG